MANKGQLIDWVKFGTLLHAARIMEGFSRGQQLADRIKELCDFTISERMIYAIESGDRTPSAEIFIALQQALPELRDPEFIKPVFPNYDIDVAVISIKDKTVLL